MVAFSPRREPSRAARRRTGWTLTSACASFCRSPSQWTLIGYADIGGFGVGSDFTWQTLVGVNYEFSKTFAGKFGYRYSASTTTRTDFVYDMANSGLYLGVGIRF